MTQVNTTPTLMVRHATRADLPFHGQICPSLPGATTKRLHPTPVSVIGIHFWKELVQQRWPLSKPSFRRMP